MASDNCNSESSYFELIGLSSPMHTLRVLILLLKNCKIRILLLALSTYIHNYQLLACSSRLNMRVGGF